MNIIGANELASLKIADLGALDNLEPPPMEHVADGIKAKVLDTSISNGFNADFIRTMGGPTI